ncbi:hypothetical protein KIH41_15550 [Litoribacter ruber]|uniref:hypothetical protein n=1 Tax=Litoribacter ruber TaxID=702568 RepID=UPI001BD98229|nr:hypothetical protein [Litoribacter ruber]MBT0812703.1 hypothetical protein [Litoribacter ruber]
MNSSQFLSLIEKGNELQRDDLHHLIKLHQSFPYFQIPMVLAAKIEYARDSTNEEFLHWAAALSPNRVWLKKILEQDIDFKKVYTEPVIEKIEEPEVKDQPEIIIPQEAQNEPSGDQPEIVESQEQADKKEEKPEIVTSPEEAEKETQKPRLITGEEVKSKTEEEKPEVNLEPAKEDEDKSIIEPLPGPPSNRVDILRQLEENLSKLKKETPSDSVDTPKEMKAEAEPEAKPAPKKKPIKRKKRQTDEILESIKKRDKKEIKDTKKLAQSDIIKEFSKKSIKMAAIRENEDVNKLEDLSTKSTQINERLVSESYAKLLTQQGKTAAAKEIYQKLILKFPQKKAYFADLMKKLED